MGTAVDQNVTARFILWIGVRGGGKISFSSSIASVSAFVTTAFGFV